MRSTPASMQRLAAPAAGQEHRERQQPERERRQDDGEAPQRGDGVLQVPTWLLVMILMRPAPGGIFCGERLRKPQAADDVEDDDAQVEDDRVARGGDRRWSCPRRC